MTPGRCCCPKHELASDLTTSLRPMSCFGTPQPLHRAHIPIKLCTHNASVQSMRCLIPTVCRRLAVVPSFDHDNRNSSQGMTDPRTTVHRFSPLPMPASLSNGDIIRNVSVVIAAIMVTVMCHRMWSDRKVGLAALDAPSCCIQLGTV